MEYLALYRKWRPRTFAEFVGQPHVVRTLKNAVAQDRISHAYLFCGPRGTGKTTAAKILAKAVNCGSPKEGDPCGECQSCRRIAGGGSLDIQEIDGASNRGIDEVRDLREKVRFAPAEGRFRVYIIDEVHMLTGEAFNALLKTLEEPPPHVIFIFATTEPHKLPATVLSRCQRFEFKRFARAEIAGHLLEIARAEEIGIEPGAVSLIAAQAAGGMRDAIGLLEQAAAHAGANVTTADVREVLGLVELEVYKRLVEAVRDRDAAAALGILDEVGEAGKDLLQFAKSAAGLWRDLLVLAVSHGPAPLQIIAPDEADTWRELAAAIGPERLLSGVEVLAGTASEQRRAGENRLPLDLAMIKLASEMDTATCSTPLRSVAAVQDKPAPVNPPPARRRAADQPAAEPVRTQHDGGPAGDGVDKWPAVQAKLRKLKPSLWSLLANGRPMGIRGQTYIVVFTNEVFVEKARRETGVIEPILAEVFGAPLTFRCEREDSPPSPNKATGDPVAETVRLFDGTLEEE